MMPQSIGQRKSIIQPTYVTPACPFEQAPVRVDELGHRPLSVVRGHPVRLVRLAELGNGPESLVDQVCRDRPVYPAFPRHAGLEELGPDVRRDRQTISASASSVMW